MDGSRLIVGGGPTNVPGNNWRAFATADFNGDGKSDVAFQDVNTGQISVWQMNGSSLIRGGGIPNITVADYRAVGAGDFNGDGKTDIFFQNVDSSLAVWLLDGTTLLRGGAVTSSAGQALSGSAATNTPIQPADEHRGGEYS